MKVEFLIAWDDQTWNTQVHEVPRGIEPVQWANENLAPLTRFRKAVLFAVASFEEDMPRDYLVSWKTDIEAHSATEAAEKALQIQRDPDSVATCFEVTDRETGVETAVMLTPPCER